MAGQRARPHYQRARREAEKAERRGAILAAAGALLSSVGFEAFSMAVLAKKTGMAKGTLYLYFATREEVLLALLVERQGAWSRALAAGLHEGIADDEFVQHFLETSLADPTLLELQTRLGSVIEHNISLERLIGVKRAMRDVVASLAVPIERYLELRPGDGARVLTALGALLLGASQVDAGPALEGDDLPVDVVEFAQLFSRSDLFREHARLLLAGVRASGG
jgi:AcrR family transcriptional regulator